MSDDLIKITPPGDRKDYEIHNSIEKAEALSSGRLKSDLTNPKGIGLCFTCERAHVTKRGQRNTYLILCGEFSGNFPMPDDITECNKYSKVTDMSLYQMTQMATLIDVREAGGHYV